MSRLEERSERANEKVEQAKEKLPTKKKIKKQRLYDEESGKVKMKLSFEDEVVQTKTGKRTIARAGAKATDAATLAVSAKVHVVCVMGLVGCNDSASNNQENQCSVYSFTGGNEQVEISNSVIDETGGMVNVEGTLNGEENVYQLQLELTDITS